MMNPCLLCYEFHVRKTKDAIHFIMFTGERHHVTFFTGFLYTQNPNRNKQNGF